MLPAVLLAAVYLIWSPPSADLAAQTFRTDLFDSEGFAIWSNAWYGGFYLPGYSLLFPPLASILGVQLVGAISAVAATALFGALVRPHYGDRARLAIFLFGLGSATNLFTGRLTFALGVAVGMGALLALDRDRPVAAGVLAALTALASPVAGLFAAFAAAVLFVRGRRVDGLVLGLPPLISIAILAVLFPTEGVEPFAANTFLLIAAAILILVLVPPRGAATIRLAAVLYLLMCLALFAVDTPVGGNATRLGALMAAPLLALAAWGKRPRAVVLVALVPLLYWQWLAPVRDFTHAVGEPSVERSYYDPLLAQLERRAPDEPFRVHVPPTRNRWESVYVAASYPLARGWLRQLESDDFELFQDSELTAGAYRRWLDERGVALVAISTGAEPDYLSEDEIDLIHGGLPYLERVWSNRDWELYAVDRAAPLAEAPARMTSLGPQGFELEASVRGEYRVSVRYTPFYEVVEGRGEVSEEGGWTLVRVDEPGRVRVEARFP